MTIIAAVLALALVALVSFRAGSYFATKRAARGVAHLLGQVFGTEAPQTEAPPKAAEDGPRGHYL
jgi:hypothetical protein